MFSAITIPQLNEIFHDASVGRTEQLAQNAMRLTRQFFGRTISLYAPLYLSNFCSSHCTYCGFNSHNKIKRSKLTEAQMHKEMSHIADSGIENILLLTGESYQTTPLSYLQKAVKIAKTYFPNISLEVHPMEEEEYRQLYSDGVDGITLYQETYDRKVYTQVHLSGKKKDYNYRFGAPERIARAGMRHISMGILLGLGNLPEDLFDLFTHLRSMEKDFPGVEYSLSFPRLRKIKGTPFRSCEVDDIAFIKTICLTRILFPRVGINLSTRESADLRDNLLNLGVTRMSAGSNTSVGGYTIELPEKQNPQFDIEDARTTKEIIQMLKKNDFDPVLTDWRRIDNEPL